MIAWSASGDFEKAVLPNGIRLFFREAPRFKTTLLVALQRASLSAREVTPLALLPHVLRRGCRAFPTERALRRRLDRMYGASLEVDVTRLGPHQVLSWELDVPCERFVPGAREDLLAEGFFLLRDVVADPVVAGGGFRPDVVFQEKRRHAVRLAALDEQKDRLAYVRCRRMLARGSAWGLDPMGRRADLARIDREGLYRLYRRWLAETPFDLYAMGPVGRDAAWRCAAAALAFPRRERAPRPVVPPPPPARARFGAARQDVAQTRLCLAFSVAAGGWSARRTVREEEAFLFYGALLGGHPRSRLFRRVREEAGLAYSVSAFADRAAGWLFVEAGVAPARAPEARRLILHEVEALAREGPTDGEFVETRAAFRQGLRRLADARRAQIDAHYEEGLLGRAFSRVRALRRLASLTPADVVRTARRARLSAVFTLEPAGRRRSA